MGARRDDPGRDETIATVVRLTLVDPGRDETDDLSLTDVEGAREEEALETVESLLLMNLVEVGGPMDPLEWKEGMAGRDDEDEETEEEAGIALSREGLKAEGAGGGGAAMLIFFAPPKNFLDDESFSFFDAGTTSGLASVFSFSF